MHSLLLFFASMVADSDPPQKAIQDLNSVPGYRFSVSSGNAAMPLEAAFQKDQPLYAKADQVEFFRKGDVLVYKQGDQWQRTRTGTVSDPLRILGASAKVKAVRLPHEELTTIAKAKIDWKKSDEKGRVIWIGNVDEGTAKLLAPIEDRGVARSAVVRIGLDAQGQVLQYEIAIRVQGRRGNAEVDGTIRKSVSVREAGKSKVDVPEGAKKALEQTPPK
jgi:hypothetical protein